jgi:hypothetical protein
LHVALPGSGTVGVLSVVSPLSLASPADATDEAEPGEVGASDDGVSPFLVSEGEVEAERGLRGGGVKNVRS